MTIISDALPCKKHQYDIVMHHCRGTEHKKINLLFMLCRFDFRSGVDLNKGLI